MADLYFNDIEHPASLPQLTILLFHGCLKCNCPLETSTVTVLSVFHSIQPSGLPFEDQPLNITLTELKSLQQETTTTVMLSHPSPSVIA